MKIDFSFYVALILAFFSRQIDVYMTYVIAILIHECGHLVFATWFKWRVASFRLTAIGGFLSFENHLTHPFGEQIVVAWGGIVFNFAFALVLFFVNGPGNLIYTQLVIGVFNLLPISPLDGSKIFHLLLGRLFSYKKSLDVLRVTNFIFLFLFAGATWALRLEQYYLVVVVLAVLVVRFGATVPYLHERHKIQKGSY